MRFFFYDVKRRVTNAKSVLFLICQILLSYKLGGKKITNNKYTLKQKTEHKRERNTNTSINRNTTKNINRNGRYVRYL